MKTIHFTSAAMLCGILSLGFTSLSNEYDISPKHKVGDTFTYKIAGSFEPLEAKISGTTVNKVIELQEGGSYIMESTGTMILDAAAFGQMELPMPTTRSTIGRNGEVIAVYGGDPEMTEGFGRLSNMNSFIWPEGPVKIGDTWTHEYKVNPETGGVAATVTYKVLEETTVIGADALAISVDFKESEAGGGSMKGVVWIEIGTGVMLQTDIEMTNVTIAMAPFPINGATTVTLQR